MRQRLWFRVLLIVCCLLFAVILAAGTTFYLHPLWVNSQLESIQMHLLGARSYERQIAGHRIHFYEAGNGAPLVLVHGLGGHAEEWSRLLPYFTSAHFHVYMLDLPGFGRSDRPADYSYSIADQSAVVEAFLADRGLARTGLGGWSMGGWIAAKVALDHPAQIERLILFDSAGPRFVPGFNPHLFAPRSTEQMNELDAVLMPHPRPIPGFVMNDILRFVAHNGWIVDHAMNAMLTGRDVLDDRYSELKIPVLLVWGSRDQITPLALGEGIHAKVSDSRLLIVDGCGHLAPVQCSAAIGPRAAEFLSATIPPAAGEEHIAP